MSYVFVVDSEKRALDPVHPGRARMLRSSGRAAVFRRAPFTIVLKTPCDAPTRSLRLKVDPGSRTTGLAVIDDDAGRVVFAAELSHRGVQVHLSLQKRSALRHARRSRNLRHRRARFLNRRRREGWLPPSLESRVSNILTWAWRLCRLAPIAAMSVELVRFDTQLMQNPEITGLEYQQGTLAGYELREYLLEKWGRRCAYCDREGIPLEIDHILSRARGGTDRVTNLTLACRRCNRAKGNRVVDELLRDDPVRLERLLALAKTPLRDAAAMNATRKAVDRGLRATGLSIEVGSGGRTKWNRTRRNLPKTHWLDAACVGASTPEQLCIDGIRPLLIRARGHGHRRHCTTDRYGFPRSHRDGRRLHFGFRTGDLVRASLPGTGKRSLVVVGRITIRSTPQFAIGRRNVHPRHCTRLQRADGYEYAVAAVASGRARKSASALE